MSFVLELIWSIFRNMLHLLSFGRHTITNSLNVYIKSNTGSTLSVDLDPKWDIKNVKEVVAPQLGLTPEELKVIFAGKELDDSIVVEDCDLGEKSILHVVKAHSVLKKNVLPENQTSESLKPLSETLYDLQTTEMEGNDTKEDSKDVRKRAHFYVYCASPCRKMQTGKLRVRCLACGSGAFTVDRDPQNWDDVLKLRRITGHCDNEDCVGEGDGPTFAHFYFKCAEHVSQGEYDSSVPLHLIRTNIHEVPCLACTDVCEVVLVFPCDASHVTCLDCFRTYCSSRLQERQFWSHPEYGYTLPCPAACPDSFISEVHHFRLLSPQQYAQYQRFGAEEYVLQAGGVLCPQPGCGMGIIADPECKRITCSNGCGFVFCRQCLQGYHLGECATDGEGPSGLKGDCQYSVDLQKAEKARWDEASKVTIKVLTKPCPKCRTPTERDGGCMHMVCTRPQCGFHWCWVCQTEWTRDCMGSHWFG